MSSEASSSEYSSANIDAIVNPCLRAVSKCTASSNAIPGEKKQDWDYYSTFAGFRQVMGVERTKIEATMDKVLAWSGIKAKTANITTAEMMELLTEANDQILERINMKLDEASGIKKDADPLLVSVATPPHRAISGSWNRKRNSAGGSGEKNGVAAEPIKLLTAKNISRPQLAFKKLIDNTNAPFVPRLKEKPHSRKPLSILVEYAEDGREFFSHPYLFELEALRPLEKQLEISNCKQKPRDLEEVELVLVNTPEKLNAMVQELRREPILAVDTEHHRYRTFLGITSLVQISSPDKDYIVDPYPIWTEMTLLNELFADPKIVKVIHGADNDVMWLQRDFSVYLVNLFDTHLAAKTLNFPNGCRNYAFVLHNYCDVRADKKYQLADWRVRPLPEEMLRYARMDTRYLIHIYHRMKNELIESGNENNNLLVSTLDASTEICRRRFNKPIVSESSHLGLLRRSGINFNTRQMYALKQLYKWRDKVAREEDESEAFILPDHMLLKICSELPREMQGILACCNPTPPLVKQNLQQIHLHVLKGREEPLTSSLADIETAQGTSVPVVKSDLEFMENPLKCPLDLGPITELTGSRNVDKSDTGVSKVVRQKPNACMDVFGPDSPLGSNEASQKVKMFLSPYQRYQMLKPYMEFINSRNDSKEAATTDDRIRSIREHFETLTAMTAEDYTAARGDESAVKDEPEESEGDEMEKEEKDILEDNDAGKVQPLRAGLKAEKNVVKKRKKKQKTFEQFKKPKFPESEGPTTAPAAADVVDYENADFTQFSSKGKAGQATGQYNPFDNSNKKTKNGGAGGKQKQRYRAGGKSVSYKK